MTASRLFDLIGAKVGLVGPRLSDRAARAPRLDLREAFSGTLAGRGAVFDYAGRMNDGFYAVMRCKWDGDRCDIDEDFIFDYGRRDKRVWSVQFTDANRFTLAGPEIPSGGGEQCGDAVRMRYKIRTEVAGSQMTLTMDDWMFLSGDLSKDGALINRSRLFKAGIKVGEICANFTRTLES